jgi:hypothetical protein
MIARLMKNAAPTPHLLWRLGSVGRRLATIDNPPNQYATRDERRTWIRSASRVLRDVINDTYREFEPGYQEVVRSTGESVFGYLSNAQCCDTEVCDDDFFNEIKQFKDMCVSRNKLDDHGLCILYADKRFGNLCRGCIATFVLMINDKLDSIVQDKPRWNAWARAHTQKYGKRLEVELFGNTTDEFEKRKKKMSDLQVWQDPYNAVLCADLKGLRRSRFVAIGIVFLSY